jgi:hypothetical protein
VPNYNVHELAGDYFIAVVPHDDALGTAFDLLAVVAPPIEPYNPITLSVPTFPVPVVNAATETLILYHSARVDGFFGAGSFVGSGLSSTLESLALHPAVQGQLIDLALYPEFATPYSVWDSQPGNPLAANFVAVSIKSLLYSLAQAYPNLKYLVLVGDDRVIPQRRIQDVALVANERHYAETAATTILSGTLALRYFLSDDYYAGLLPFPYQGRELYLPQFAIGRLVETPAQMRDSIGAFLSQSVLFPQDGFVTGYDFLIDEASAISQTLTAQGITPLDTLIDNTWLADDFRNYFFDLSDAHDLNSLNSHFEHHRLIPNGAEYVYAAEVTTDTTEYKHALIFTVGCHSGLNVPDDDQPDPQLAADWAQVFLAKQALFIGNTGFGYGDSDLIAYSERLMTNFVQELGYWHNGNMPTVGIALARAKQRYFNSTGAESFSNYDEKALEEMTLYGLPMMGISVPNTTTVPPGGGPLGKTSMTVLDSVHAAQAITVTTHTFDSNDLAYDMNSVAGLGNYFTLQGSEDVHVAGGRPIQPRVSTDIHLADTIAHGVLMLGGTFTDIPNFNPVMSRMITEELYLVDEPPYPTDEWYPVSPATINRFLNAQTGQSNERLVLIPGQFRATGSVSPTVGVERLYTALQLEVYHASFDEDDFVAPAIFEVDTYPSTGQVDFEVLVNDDDGPVMRVVVLYRSAGSNVWQSAELVYDPDEETATGTVLGLGGTVEFIVQAVDSAGNVALSLDHGKPYTVLAGPLQLFLPIVKR